MHKQITLVLATLALSGAAFAQSNIRQDGPYQIGFAANLNIGDSEVNLSNDGNFGGFVGAVPIPSAGNICVNAYIFDSQEEEIACCYCLVTPNGLNSFSVQKQLASNPLTPATPTSVVIKLLASIPGTVGTPATATVCNPAGITGATAFGGPAPTPYLLLANGMLAWGTTLEPASTPGTYAPVSVNFLQGGTNFPPTAVQGTPVTAAAGGELGALMSVCNFIQVDGTGFGLCKSCNLGALSGAKQ